MLGPAYGGIYIEFLDGTSEEVWTPYYVVSSSEYNENGWAHAWRDYSVSQQFTVSNVSKLLIRGKGTDPDYSSTNSYLTNLKVKFE